MSNLTFTEFQIADARRIEQFKNAKGEPAHKGRDGADWTELEWAGSLSGEAGELANFCKKLRRGDYTLDEVVPDKGVTLRQCIADEIADVVAYASIIASRIGVDFGDVCRDKFNRVSERVGSDVFLSEEPIAVKAQRAYERYCADAGYLNFRGDQCPPWEDLPVSIQQHWIAAVQS